MALRVSTRHQRRRLRLALSTGLIAVLATALPVPAFARSSGEMLYGHRGFVGQIDGRIRGDENTIQSCLNARAAGALGCEFDTRITRDNAMVLMHDGSLDRTTNCRGRVDTKSYAGIARYCRTANGWRVPTLNQFLAIVNRHAPATTFQQEIKDAISTSQASRLLDIYARYGLTDRVLLTSRRLSVLRSLEQLNPSVRKGWIANPGNTFTGTDLAAARGVVDQVVLHVSDASDSYVSALRRNGFAVQVWGVATTAEFTRLRSLGTEGVITRRIKRLSAIP